MSDFVNMKIQRWVYERGNYQIIVENAWALSPKPFTQERITVNGESVREEIPLYVPILRWRTVFEDSVLVPGEDLELKVQWRSALWTVLCRLKIDGVVEDWTQSFKLNWIGAAGEWPDVSDYEA